uniref:metallophosphoesterase n=3 Tax=Flavobacterium sp. TaxID=239 RepID=UPI00404A7520
MYRLIFFVLFVFLVEWYVFQAVRTITRFKWIHYSYLILTVLFISYIVYSFLQFDRSVGQNTQTLFTLGFLLTISVPKIIIATFLFGEDICRLFVGVIQFFVNESKAPTFLPTRLKWVSFTAIIVSFIPFTAFIHGILFGKYNYKVIPQTVYFKDLPQSFDGFTITHISDIHVGSFDNKAAIEKAIKMINVQNSDMILFTGDIVNTHASEMDPWISVFKEINSPPFGKYSVLGNHDYGEYISWPSELAKDANFIAIKNIHEKIGFQLLLNENINITKGNDSLKLIGVENWGHNFKKAGDLKLASVGVQKEDFKILMSHDPSHWEYEVKKDPMNYQLTLSGHTHGFQFGFEIPGVFQWSPVQYVYKQWAGLYEHASRYIYVNRGFGYHAYPGRVGIWPEITVITLKKQ